MHTHIHTYIYTHVYENMAIGNIDKMSMNLGCEFFCTKKTCSKDIMVPNVGTLHEQVALLAQKSGRHVLLEKPISVTCHAGGDVSQEMIGSNWPVFFFTGDSITQLYGGI